MGSRDDQELLLRRFERRGVWIRRLRSWLPTGLSLLVGSLLLIVPRESSESGSPPGGDSLFRWTLLAEIVVVVAVAAIATALFAIVLRLVASLRYEPPEHHELADSAWAEVVSAHRRGDANR